MKSAILILPSVLAALLVVSLPLFAHHGWSTFDSSRELTVTGTVSEFEFVNPHVEISLMVKDAQGHSERWIGQGSSPNMLIRKGITRNSMKMGDRITATGHPARNGAKAILIEKLVLMDGKEVTFSSSGN